MARSIWLLLRAVSATSRARFTDSLLAYQIPTILGLPDAFDEMT
jgi:hypothetical protein